jgi:hypothetical protein
MSARVIKVRDANVGGHLDIVRDAVMSVPSASHIIAGDVA